mmetsp:Transcript_7518/g.20564  ORF Transcript_7518/g.20564 Transcript_7518/m.20564 type:complete len:260 (-) Transcript_7518:353-1132(-)
MCAVTSVAMKMETMYNTKVTNTLAHTREVKEVMMEATTSRSSCTQVTPRSNRRIRVTLTMRKARMKLMSRVSIAYSITLVMINTISNKVHARSSFATTSLPCTKMRIKSSATKAKAKAKSKHNSHTGCDNPILAICKFVCTLIPTKTEFRMVSAVENNHKPRADSVSNSTVWVRGHVRLERRPVVLALGDCSSMPLQAVFEVLVEFSGGCALSFLCGTDVCHGAAIRVLPPTSIKRSTRSRNCSKDSECVAQCSSWARR